MYDVIVIGHGPAGLSASIFTSRAHLKTLVIGEPKKSQSTEMPRIRLPSRSKLRGMDESVASRPAFLRLQLGLVPAAELRGIGPKL